MNSKPLPFKTVLLSTANFLAISILFAIAYAQSPLYSSNQNQYFLHGLAAAGFGTLENDWLANTSDPTPIFSKLVEWTYRATRQKEVFYAYYAILMGIYINSLTGLADRIYGILTSRSKSLAFIALFFLIHSAGSRFILGRGLGANWTYVLEDGVADQRMLGPVLQPSTFGVFLALSLLLFVNGKPLLAVIASAMAAIFHPTYLLSAGLLTLTYCLILWTEERKISGPLVYGMVALAMVSPVILYTATNFLGTSPEKTQRAQETLVSFRIPHHALVSQWFDASVLFKLALVAAAIALTWQLSRSLGREAPPRLCARRLAVTLLSLSTAAILLTVLQVLTGSLALALVFPWRISILIVPISTTLLLGGILDTMWRSPRMQTANIQRIVKLLSTLLIFVTVLIGAIRFKLDLDRRITEEERSVEHYVYAHHSPADVYLTPIQMQDFRLESGAPVWIDFKSIPYRDTDVLEWRSRIRLTNRFYANPDCANLQALLEKEALTHVVLPTDLASSACPELSAVYRDPAYMLYRLQP